MGMNRQELAKVVEALQRCVGRPFDTVWQPGRDRVVVGLADGTLLLLVPRGPFARLHSLTRRPRNPPKPFSFQGACRAHLAGRLEQIRHLAPEREVELAFTRGTLRLRLTGRSGGLWLLRDDEVVAAYDGPAPPSLPALPEVTPRDPPPAFAPEDAEDWDTAARRHYMRAESDQRLADRRRQLERDVRKAIDRSRRLATNLEADLDKASRAPAMRARADLLAAHLHEIPKGAASFTATDWSTGDDVVLPLDPAKSPSAQMEALYKKARRLDRVGDQVLERMEANDSLLTKLADALEAVSDADRAELDAIRRLLPAAPSPRRKHSAPDVLTWTGPSGERVLVGRSAKSNRKLTFQIARGSDWWFHLRERPGAHVVLPLPRDASPDLGLLLAAAQIVLVQAKIPVGSSADVQYTRVKDVRPVPGEIALVRVANEKVLHVTRDPAALVGWSSSITSSSGRG